jgi:hypothetical protein
MSLPTLGGLWLMAIKWMQSMHWAAACKSTCLLGFGTILIGSSHTYEGCVSTEVVPSQNGDQWQSAVGIVYLCLHRILIPSRIVTPCFLKRLHIDQRLGMQSCSANQCQKQGYHFCQQHRNTQVDHSHMQHSTKISPHHSEAANSLWSSTALELNFLGGS